MARRKRPGISDYLDGLEKPAVATSKRKGKGKAQTAPKPTATAGKRRKITLYFGEALLEDRSVCSSSALRAAIPPTCRGSLRPRSSESSSG